MYVKVTSFRTNLHNLHLLFQSLSPPSPEASKPCMKEQASGKKSKESSDGTHPAGLEVTGQSADDLRAGNFSYIQEEGKIVIKNESLY